MRIAWWSPMPPQPSGIADYSFDVLGALAPHLDVLAVVDDEVAASVRAPAGVTTAGATAYTSGAVGPCDLDVYQMGNHPWFHAYMHARALDHAGVLVLHDTSLLDFYERLCGGADSALFLAEARHNDPTIEEVLPTVVVDDRLVLDRMSLPMTRRLVEASLVTLVHNEWARDDLVRRLPTCRISVLRPSAGHCAPRYSPNGRRPGTAVFGVFGGLAPNKRLPAVLHAFAEVHREFPEARLVVAGRSDFVEVQREVQRLVCSLALEDAVRMATDVPLETLQQEIEGCDVAIALRWPSAGETSGVVMRSLGAGKPVIVSDLPQYVDFDPASCWRVPTDPLGEREALVSLMRSVLSDPAGCEAVGRSARSFREAGGSLAAARDRYLEVVDELATARQEYVRVLPPAGDGSCLPGVNLLGDWWATTGLAEAARRSAGALVAAGAHVSVINFPVPDVPRDETRAPAWLWDLPHDRAHPVDLWFLNVNEFGVLSDLDLRPQRTGRYTIASWFWELPRIATSYAAQVDRVDEIWVGSQFAADAFSSHTHKPVEVVPCVVEPAADARVTRGDLGLPEDACLYLFSFDASSFLARKNPWGVVRAFHEAFGPQERRGPVRLVVKTVNLGRFPEARARLAARIAQVGGLLIEDDLAAADMHALISLCDVYVSLHRSEGFGLGMAEAMYFGRPVIATAYSGNMDFTRQSNSCLVGYKLRPIDPVENSYDPGIATIYETGQMWAEPDLAQAARWMRLLYERPGVRRRLGAAGAATIRREYSSAAAQAVMITRLEEVARARSR
jgi:glycosyltransferase involved in cell wall biosynthesis